MVSVNVEEVPPVPAKKKMIIKIIVDQDEAAVIMGIVGHIRCADPFLSNLYGLLERAGIGDNPNCFAASSRMRNNLGAYGATVKIDRGA